MINTTFRLNGITCNGCISTLTKLFSGMEGIHQVNINKEDGKVVLKGSTELNMVNVENAIQGYPKYTLIRGEATLDSQPAASSLASFKPLIIIIGFIFLLVAMSQITKGHFDWRESMRLFMGGFFIAFSFFKFLDLKGFAQAYQSYDIIAEKWIGWGYIYPFIELGLGLMFLFSFFPFYASLITLVVLSLSSIGVIKSVLSKQSIKCACLGTGFNLPMTTVTIIEDLSMVVMSAIMLASM